ncbi:prolyl oligopeptidase family serine peptidase [Aquirufa ecclesiirivi]|uniref:prolyl oligopeptidase family serine peptidase n=1 Tax=Aquirufa ecclesiirivi TaxID=2715124 RepID=UPI0022A80F38|nr:alpha/beta hydrolase-fold protein [Aquirufa ecclesiirivi]MCZ2471390.1 prolyl oligopeptidase family serine peptidase [Aquirufa ecclesiirivi]
MKKSMYIFALLLAMISLTTNAKPTGSYKLVVEGFDWGAGVNKVILSLSDTTSTVNAGEFSVFASRKSNAGPITEEQSSGKREIVGAYVSDPTGNRVKTGKNITLVLAVGPQLPISFPIQYFRSKGNVWVDYQLTIIHTKSQQVWDSPTGKLMPLVDQFDVTGKYKFNDQLTMSYATFSPTIKKEKAPLLIWLHGGGEGGFDPTIPLLGNKAANYASEAIQSIFEGAYVLSPQCPGAWMHNAQKVTTHGKENDVYNEGLMALIKDYVKSNPNIDPNRIYVGGCSNGGYMALKLILLYPDYFAAGYISALAYRSEYIPDADIQKIKQVPIWFVHSKDDATTIPDLTVVPVYQRLQAAGAKNVHFTYYDHVHDITNFYGGKGFQYNGHWSWVYLHENLPRTNLDGSLVKVNGKPVSIMEWLAAQKKGK